MNVVYVARERSKGNVSASMFAWAVAMTVVLFIGIVAPSATDTIVGFGISALFGIYLGWRRKIGAIFVAPFVNWLIAWFPMEIASMIHFGILKGFLLGLLIITFGWVGIGFVEFAWISMVALVVRSMRATPKTEPVVIIDPDKR